MLPQAAMRLDTRAQMWPDEVRVDVETLNLDAASFRQLAESHRAPRDGGRRGGPAEVLAIVATRGKMQNPVTGSGGMLVGTVAEVGPESPSGLEVGHRVATLVSLSLTPLVITDGLGAGTGCSEQVPANGHAILFGRSIAAVLPDDLDPRLALMVMDVCGAPALVARVVAEYAGRRAAPSVLVLGGAGKSGSLSLAAARQAGPGDCSRVVPHEREAALLRPRGWPTRCSWPTPRSPLGSPQAVGAPGDPLTSRSSASTCRAASSRRSWPRRKAARSSSSRWPRASRGGPGREGLAADVACSSATGTSPATRHTRSRSCGTIRPFGCSSRVGCERGLAGDDDGAVRGRHSQPDQIVHIAGQDAVARGSQQDDGGVDGIRRTSHA